MKRILVKIAVTCGIIIVGYTVFFSAVTPSVKGVVIDSETKKPIENAWVIVTVNSSTATIAGDVGNTDFLSQPHLRTDKEGRFKISKHLYIAGLPPLSFGRTTSRLRAIVRVADGRRAEVDLSKDLKKWSLNATIPVSYQKKRGEERFRELQNLYHYCIEGAFLLVGPPVAGGCDKWELDYMIAELEKYIKDVSKPNNLSEETNYPICLYYLALLYERRTDFEMALTAFKTARDFDLKRDVNSRMGDYKEHINSLEERLKAKQ
jgi:hypothetical protein